MAFEFEDPNEDEEEQPGGTPIPGTEGGIIQGAPGQGSAAGPTESAAGDYRSPQSAGFSGFTDISAYLDANRPQAADLSAKVAGKLTEEEQGIRSDIGKAKTDTESAIESATIRPDESLVSRAAATPAEFIKNQGDLDSFKKMRDASYAGPAGLDDETAATLTNRVTEGQRRAKGIDTEAGREELLRSLGNNVTKGMLTLDNLLLGADPNSRQTLAAAASPFEGLTSYLDETSGAVKSKADTARADTNAARNLVASKFTGDEGIVPAWKSRENAELQELSGKATGFNNSINAVLQNLASTRGLTQEQLDSLGITPSYGGGWNAEQMKKLVGEGGLWNQIMSAGFLPAVGQDFMSQYFDPAEQLGQPGMPNVSTPEEYADALALNELLGEDLGLGFEPQAFDIPSQRGKFDVGTAVNQLREQMRAVPNQVRPPDQAAKWNEFYDLLSWGLIDPDDPRRQPVPSEPEPEPSVPYPNPTSPSPGEGYVWNPTFGIWQDVGNWSGGGGNTFARPIGL